MESVRCFGKGGRRKSNGGGRGGHFCTRGGVQLVALLFADLGEQFHIWSRAEILIGAGRRQAQAN